MKGVTYFHRKAFSINEGGAPFNIHVSIKRGFFIYVYFFGFRWFYGRPSH